MSRVLSYIVLLLLIISIAHGSEQNTKAKLQEIPAEDKKAMELFFRELIQKYGFGYTLFGHKPVTLMCWPDSPDRRKTCPYKTVSEDFIANYEVWKKYQNRFRGKRILLEERVFTINETFRDIVCIDKSRFEETVKLFPACFPEDYSIQAFMDYETIDKQKSGDLDSYHMRMGLLCGYGYGNVCEFINRLKAGEMGRENWMPLGKYAFECGGVKEKSLCLLPTFSVNAHLEETKELFKRYRSEQAEITELLASGNFLEIVLEKLSE
jgi:hypothetical protein